MGELSYDVPAKKGENKSILTIGKGNYLTSNLNLPFGYLRICETWASVKGYVETL